MNKTKIKYFSLGICCGGVFTLLAVVIIMYPKFPRDSAAVQQATCNKKILELLAGLETFKADCGRYPLQEEGLKALVKVPDGLAGGFRGPYVPTDAGNPLVDPWGNPFELRIPGVHNRESFDLWSTGPDGIDDSAHKDIDDIRNW